MNIFLSNLWLILEPFVETFTMIVGPALAAWLATRMVLFLKIDNEARKLQVEQQLRDALHKSATNAIHMALTKWGHPAGAVPSADVIANAVNYVRTNNPDAVARLNVSQTALEDIILSKVPPLFAGQQKGGG
ncbi:hypothetical protein IFT84_20640 [Rhizobium sp. CFBP 8762]|uniref:hypothetical protein n=1 Tax=Rhizobium sp. CFBP 8762 TaxID=2775279 RepID=UPI00178120A9|nr:hypothetical protein [Rhizobium sp. CFBP 8762]MBD8556921.1 hypothetical protein [Rhizobium sp. CFBP 8762]